MNTKNIKVEYKSTQLISILSQNFSGKMNLARIKFLGLFIVYQGVAFPNYELNIAFVHYIMCRIMLHRLKNKI